MQEIVRRLGSPEFIQLANSIKVIRKDIPDQYDRGEGALIAVTEGRETFNVGTSHRQNQVAVYFQIAVPLGEGEEGATVFNLVSGELQEAFERDRQLKEGGTGPALAVNFELTGSGPDLDDDDTGNVAAGTQEWTLTYRTRPTGPFDL